MGCRAMVNAKSDDEKRRDEVLKRMLATLPKPHQPDVEKAARKPSRAPQADKLAKGQK